MHTSQKRFTAFMNVVNIFLASVNEIESMEDLFKVSFGFCHHNSLGPGALGVP